MQTRLNDDQQIPSNTKMKKLIDSHILLTFNYRTRGRGRETIPVFAEDSMREFGARQRQIEVVHLAIVSVTEVANGKDRIEGQNLV